MGNARSTDFAIQENPNRVAFVTFKSWRSVTTPMGHYIVFTYTIRYLRYTWDIEFRFTDMVRLDRVMFPIFADQLSALHRPVRYNKLFWTHDQEFLTTRSKIMLKYIQDLLDIQATMDHQRMGSFLNVSVSSFNPNMGRKGKEGYLKKASGGYVEGFSRQPGDYFQVWMWRWVVLHDTCICWYKSPEDPEPRGMLQIDKKFHVEVRGRVIRVFTATRKLLLHASTVRGAEEWAAAMRDFYAGSSRALAHYFDSSFPPRMNCDVTVFTTTKDYFNSLAVSLMSAQTEILMTSWKNSPTLLLTRPPFPTLRLDQLLKYKADQGVKIYILLYKEVQYVGQGNDSLRSKSYLESLSPNISVIRHPNKFIGGSTAMLWSHHEKCVVIDRNLCFVGGVDLAYQRWDDELHRVADEDGVIYPGLDYRNPAPALFKPLRAPPAKDPGNPDEEEDDVIEVEVAVPGEVLPTAATAAIDEDDAPYEVEVVVDFGVATAIEYSAPTATSVAAHNARAGQQRTKSNSSATAPPMLDRRHSGGSPAATGRKTAAVSAPPPMSLPTVSLPHVHLPHVHLPHMSQPKAAPQGSSGEEIKAGDAAPDDTDRMSEVSENWAEERFAPETAEEKEAKGTADGAGGDYEDANSEVDPNDAATMSRRLLSGGGGEGEGDRRGSTRSSFYSEIKTSIAMSKQSILSSFEFLGAQIQTAKEMYTRHIAQKSSESLEPREMYPRMPWHDVQAAVTGLVARDVAAHFIQRWNHHRISNSQYSEPILHDITDNVDFGVCARCVRAGIKESETVCPDCGYYLGPGSSYSKPVDPELCPALLSDYSYIIFECKYPGKLPLPFRMLGDCPVVVTAILHNTIKTGSNRDNNGAAGSPGGASEGTLIDLQGPQAEWLHAFGLYPALGDVLLEIDGTVVTHLNSNQCKRLVKRKRTEIRNYLAGRAFVDLSDEPMITVRFRRHFLENVHPVDNKAVGDSEGQDKEGAVEGNSYQPTKGGISAPPQPPAPSGNRILNEDELAALEGPGQDSGESPEPALPNDPTVSSRPLGSAEQKVEDAAVGGDRFAFASTASLRPATGRPSAAAIPIREVAEELRGKGAVPEETTQQSVECDCICVSAMPVDARALPLAKEDAAITLAQRNASKVKQFHPACSAAAQLEVKLAMSTLFHTFYRGIQTPNRLSDGTGTCKVQLLRSIGKWSTGTKEEISIQNCYVDSITNAKHFIYIENQFFVSGTAGSDVTNGIASALVNRILMAHVAGEPFRVVVIVPVHPNGDFISAKKAQCVMHYEYATINRGVTCMFAELRRRAPNITISNYIGFFSLRNWGVINHKVVSEQVYVHDKVLIVDDRVMIIGSANINDRSMIGERDSELAIRIEDTLHCNITMNGQPFVVGYLPHMVRTRLMRQHLGEPEDFDLSDPLTREARDFWTRRSNSNSAIYDQIDGGTSVYRCTTISQWKDAFSTYVNPSYLDPTIKATMAEIKGFLVDWPQTFLEREDLSPNLALRAIVPNSLWC